MLGVRLDETTEKGLGDLARRTRRTKSDIAREAIARFVRSHDEALAMEARRQSENSVLRGWTEEDAHWESVIATDDFDAAPPGDTD